MGIFDPKNKTVEIENIGLLEYETDTEGNFFSCVRKNDAVGNTYELYFDSKTNVLSEFQIDYFHKIIAEWDRIKNEIAETLSSENIGKFDLEIMLIPEYQKEDFDVELNFVAGDKFFAVPLKDLEIQEIYFHEF